MTPCHSISSPYSPPGMTEVTLKRQEEVSNSLKERGNILEQEKQELVEINEQLQAEINSLRRMTSFKDTGRWSWLEYISNLYISWMMNDDIF